MCGPWAVFSLTWPLPPSWRRKRPSPDWGKSERTPTNWRKCLKMLPRYDLLFITEKGYISLQWPGTSFSDFSKTFFMGRSPKWAILLSYTCKCNSLYLTYYKSILLKQGNETDFVVSVNLLLACLLSPCVLLYLMFLYKNSVRLIMHVKVMV